MLFMPARYFSHYVFYRGLALSSPSGQFNKSHDLVFVLIVPPGDNYNTVQNAVGCLFHEAATPCECVGVWADVFSVTASACEEVHETELVWQSGCQGERVPPLKDLEDFCRGAVACTHVCERECEYSFEAKNKGMPCDTDREGQTNRHGHDRSPVY